ncbi:hypothetical protein FRX31_018115 [Thalictrum thalictroides]|uniref:Uncharacterized protein n=1 Tax=Thalictrum thalictroides TaxID=46969 RepID=A0A7J6W681_THATH|nr:hypothetical protein FRX31_018115 [Thalictrum thalictroides]
MFAFDDVNGGEGMHMAEYGAQQQRAEGEARLWGSDLQMDRAVPGLLKEGIDLVKFNGRLRRSCSGDTGATECYGCL